MGFFRRDRAPTYTAKIVDPDLISARKNGMRAELEIVGKELEAQGLLAAGSLVRHGQATLLRRLIQSWQIRAFGYYDMLGEIKYASQFYSRALSQLILYAAEENDDGEIVATENEDVKAALDRIRDPGGSGRSGLLADYGRLMFLTGEAYLFVSLNPNTELEQWEMLSTDELRLMDGLYTRFRAPVLAATQFHPAPDDAFKPIDDDSAVAYRIWKRHPRFSELADSTMQGVLDLCEELVLLTQAVRARARSRLAGPGILFLDDRITTQPAEPVPDEDAQEDPTLADLTEAMTKPIINEGTAGAVVPLLARVRVPEGAKLSDLVYHLQIIDPQQLYPETGLRMECIKRIAIGLDMPPEILLGVADANHWTGWLIDEQSWKAHLQPIADQLVQDLTSAYLGPYLKEQGIADWQKYTLAYDATAIINHPDRTKDAKDLYAAGVLSDEALRDAGGFDEDTKPSEAEKNRWLGVKLHDSSVAIFGVPALRQGAILEPAEGELEAAPAPGGAPTAGGESAADAQKTPPEKQEAPPEENVIGSLNGAARAAQIHGAAQLGVLRAREAAGAKLRTLCRRDDDLVKLIDGVPTRDVAATIGRTAVRAIPGVPGDAALIRGARELIMEGLRAFDVTDPAVAGEIADAVQAHAVSTLYDLRPAPLPASFPDYVRGLIAG